MKYLFFCYCIFLTFPIHAQVLEGTIISQTTKETIPFTHIYCKELRQGTITNEFGEFQLNTVKKGRLTLQIRHVGFEPLDTILAIASFAPVVLSLKESTQTLEEVVIKDRASVYAEEILRILKNTSKINYGRAFYRQLSFRDSTAYEFIESFYAVGATINGISGIKVEQARFARKPVPKNRPCSQVVFSTFSHVSIGYELYSKDSSIITKPFSEPYFEEYNFDIQSQYIWHQDTIVSISFQPSKRLKSQNLTSYGEIHYNISSHRLVDYTVHIDYPIGPVVFDCPIDRLNMEVQNPVYTITFSFSDKEPSIEYILTNFTFDFAFRNKIIPTRVASKLVFFESNKRKLFGLKIPTERNSDVSYLERAKYKPKFWNDNPIVKRTKQEEQMIQTFEKDNAFGSYFR